MDSKESSKSWFCVFNNPQEIYSGEPFEIAEKCLEEWVRDRPTRTGWVAYCISADGLHHLHMVLEDSNKARFSTLKNTYPKAHLEPTKGTKEQAEDYINKKGKFQEKGEQVVYIAKFGEIKGNQGARKDFDIIEDMLENGSTPNQIMDANFGFRRYEKMIKQAYFRKRKKGTSNNRKVTSYFHIGESGSGKSYVHIEIEKEHGEDYLYMYSDYDNGGLDNYNGEPILFMDEFRGQIKFYTLLGILEGYKKQFHARYSDIEGLWNEVHITSILPPEKLYEKMVQDNRNLDTYQQLKRRINYIVYHYTTGEGENIQYLSKTIPMSKYTNYETLKRDVENENLPDWVKEADKCETIPMELF